MVAIDESQNTIKEIALSLSKELGPGKVAAVSAEEAFLEEDVTQVEFDMLTVNLRMEPASVADMPFEWVSREGLVDNMPAVITEFKDTRNLQPVKVCVLGPPASGKTSLAKMLSDMYKVPRVGVDNVVEQTLVLVRASASRVEAMEDGDEQPDEDDLEQVCVCVCVCV